MPLALDDDPDGRVSEVVQAAVRLARLGSGEWGGDRSAWWRAGLRDALEHGEYELGAADRYEAAPPRRTRGATRA